MENKEKSITTVETATKIGRAIGSLFAYIVAGCISATAVALTVKFIMWLF